MRAHYFFLLLIPGLSPGVSHAQAVARTDTPRGGQLRVSFEPVVTTWDDVFTPVGRQPLGAALPARVFVHSERRVTPLELEFGITDHITLGAQLPLVRAANHAGVVQDSAGAGAALDSTLADTTYAFAAIRNSRRGLRYFAGDAEVSAKLRLGPREGAYAAALRFRVRLPTGRQDSPHDLFDMAAGDHQTDLELQLTQELTLLRLLWLNLSVRAVEQRPGIRGRRVASQSALLVPRAAWSRLAWDPGDELAVDFAPLLRLAPHFGAGPTVGYYTKRRDRYTFSSAADSVALATRLGFPRSAAVLDAGTAERRLRQGVAVTYAGPNASGEMSIEWTVSGVGARVPAATVFRILFRTSRWPF
jgi:hypothetical protein